MALIATDCLPHQVMALRGADAGERAVSSNSMPPEDAPPPPPSDTLVYRRYTKPLPAPVRQNSMQVLIMAPMFPQVREAAPSASRPEQCAR